MANEFEQLRKVMDGGDPFMTGGHQIIKSAGATRHADRLLRVPDWALDDSRIKQMIVSRYPKYQTSERQRKMAGRLIRIVHLYYRVGYTAAAIAEEIGVSTNTVELALRRANRAINENLRYIGRPRKYEGIETSNETSGTGVL